MGYRKYVCDFVICYQLRLPLWELEAIFFSMFFLRAFYDVFYQQIKVLICAAK